MNVIYTSIDLGSDSIKAITSEVDNGKLHVLASSNIKSSGIKKGLIVNNQLASKALKEAIEKLEDVLGIEIRKVIASVPINQARYKIVEGQIDIDSDNKQITGSCISKLFQNAVYKELLDNEELVTILPIHFTIDGKIVKNVLESKGNKLGVKAQMVTTPKKNVYSVISLLENLGIEVVDITLGAIGDYFEFKNEITDSNTGLIINIGGDITTVSIFSKGVIASSDILNMGGINIEKDISYIYKISRKEAKNLKETFAVAHPRYADMNEIYETINESGEILKISQHELSLVVNARLEEILNLAKKQAKLLTNKEISYIIITGGTTEIEGFKMVVDLIYKRKAIIGEMKTIGIRHSSYSSASGMIKYLNKKLELRGNEYSMISLEEKEKLISDKRRMVNFSSNSVIGKVVNYFFDN